MPYVFYGGSVTHTCVSTSDGFLKLLIVVGFEQKNKKADSIRDYRLRSSKGKHFRLIFSNG